MEYAISAIGQAWMLVNEHMRPNYHLSFAGYPPMLVDFGDRGQDGRAPALQPGCFNLPSRGKIYIADRPKERIRQET